MRALGLTRFIAVAALAVVAIFAFAGSASAQPGYGDDDDGNGSACVSLSSSVSAGTITAVGSCFDSGESVTGTVFSEAIDLGTKDADRNGVVVFTIVVKDLAPGEHKVVLDGSESGSASAKFTVNSDGDVKVVPASFVTETPAGGSSVALAGIAALVAAGGGVALLSVRRSKSRV